MEAQRSGGLPSLSELEAAVSEAVRAYMPHAAGAVAVFGRFYAGDTAHAVAYVRFGRAVVRVEAVSGPSGSWGVAEAQSAPCGPSSARTLALISASTPAKALAMLRGELERLARGAALAAAAGEALLDAASRSLSGQRGAELAMMYVEEMVRCGAELLQALADALALLGADPGRLPQPAADMVRASLASLAAAEEARRSGRAGWEEGGGVLGLVYG